MSGTTISILSARLLLVHIARSEASSLMAPVVDCMWHRGRGDPFFALCVNGIEVSLFADAGVVRRSFGEYIKSKQPEEEEGGEEEESGGAGEESGRRTRERTQRPETSTGIKEAVGKVEVGEDIWVALEISFHGDGWEDAGHRVKELSSPLADEGISILFLSTYHSDYILVKRDTLSAVTTILERSGFEFTPTDESDDEEDEDEGKGGYENDYVPNGLTRNSSVSSRKSSDAGGRSLSSSLVFSERGSAGAGGNTISRSGSINRTVATGFRPSVPLPSIDPSPFLPSPTNSAPTSPPTILLPLQPAPPPPTKKPSFKLGNSLTILPDELVCVGLSHAHEDRWRAKLVETIFYPSRILSNPPPPSSSLPSSRILSRTNSLSNSRTRNTMGASNASMMGGSLRNPVPFVALTQTPDGTSLTADVRLLRRVFGESEGEMVYAVGEGGLRGIWEGEDEDEDEGEEEQDEEEGEDGEDGEEWREEERERRALAEKAGEGGRKLLKCLQLDLVSFGLDKHGIVEHFAGLLKNGGVNLLFQSTFGSANILVAKKDIHKAKKILEEDGSEGL